MLRYAGALSANTSLGVVTAVAAFHAVLGLGLSSGAALVLLPRGLQSDGQPSKYAPKLLSLSTEARVL